VDLVGILLVAEVVDLSGMHHLNREVMVEAEQVEFVQEEVEPLLMVLLELLALVEVVEVPEKVILEEMVVLES
jgi:hypothetical protein